jgi:hypothetical protein
MATKRSIYAVHPGVEMVQTWIATLKEKTGRDLPSWIALARTKGPADEAARRAWLKDKHGLGTNSAWMIAERSFGRGDEEDTPERYLKTAEGYVESMFSGKKAALRPAYDALLAACAAAGPGVRICPAKTMVPVYRTHVIAQILPATATRIDFGLALGAKAPASKRLLATGGAEKKDRITYRVAVATPADVDGKVARWLATAYALDA